MVSCGDAIRTSVLMQLSTFMVYSLAPSGMAPDLDPTSRRRKGSAAEPGFFGWRLFGWRL
jgi:hypothetical protein